MSKSDEENAVDSLKQQLLEHPELIVASEHKALWIQLIEARHEAGLTQKQLAERLGTSQSQVSRLESPGNNTQTLKSLQRYVAALGKGFELDISVRTPK